MDKITQERILATLNMCIKTSFDSIQLTFSSKYKIRFFSSDSRWQRKKFDRHEKTPKQAERKPIYTNGAAFGRFRQTRLRREGGRSCTDNDSFGRSWQTRPQPEGRRSCTDYEGLDRFRKTRRQKRQRKMKLQWLLAHLEQSSSQVRKNKTYTPYPE